MPKSLDVPLCLPEAFVQSQQELLRMVLTGSVEPGPQVPARGAHTVGLGFGGGNEDFEMIGATAVVPINGMILQQKPWWMNCCSSDQTARILHELESDSAVRQVVLRINSPGGVSFAGAEIAEAVKRLNGVKPVHAFVNGEGCSAAYWVACCTRSITAAPLSVVGSIGCYILAYDYSKYLSREGIRAVMMKSGPNKGAGAAGVKITPEQQLRLQEIVDSVANEFFGIVSQARGLAMESAGEWGDGGCWTAEDGIKINLVDRICDWATFIGGINVSSTSAPEPSARRLNSNQGGYLMETNETKVAANVKQLKTAFPKATNDFIVAQLEKGATLDEAKTAYISFLESRVELLAAKSSEDEEEEEEKSSKKKSSKKSKAEDEEEDEDEEEKSSKKKSSKKSKAEDEEEEEEKSKSSGSLGNKPHGEGKSNSLGRTAAEQWNAAIKAKQDEGLSKSDAVKAVVSESPELQAAYVAEVNAKAKA